MIDEALVPEGRGVYRILNTNTGKCYIGSTKNFPQRCHTHLTLLRNDVHHSRYLQRSWNKHSSDVFRFEVIEFTPDPISVVEREQYHMDIRFAAVGTTEYNMTRYANDTAELTEMAIIAMRATRDAFDEQVYAAIIALDMGTSLPYGSAQLTSILTPIMNEGSERIVRAVRRLREQRRISILVHGTPHWPHGQPWTERKLHASLVNIRKAQANRGRHTEESRRKIGIKSRATQARLRAEGYAPNSHAYWQRMRGMTFDQMSAKRQAAYIRSRGKVSPNTLKTLRRKWETDKVAYEVKLQGVLDRLAELGLGPVFTTNMFPTAEQLAPQFGMFTETLYRAFLRLQEQGRLQFSTVRPAAWSEERRLKHEARFGPDGEGGKIAKEILDRLQGVDWVLVTDLAAQMGKNVPTLRDQLQRLERIGKVERGYGKVRSATPPPPTPAPEAPHA